jgi:hypothetical protein
VPSLQGKEFSAMLQPDDKMLASTLQQLLKVGKKFTQTRAPRFSDCSGLTKKLMCFFCVMRAPCELSGRARDNL